VKKGYPRTRVTTKAYGNKLAREKRLRATAARAEKAWDATLTNLTAKRGPAHDYFRQIITNANGTFDIRVRYTSNGKIYFTTRQGYEKRSEAVRMADAYDAAAKSDRVATHA
jgi:hypothetical protein